VVAVLLVGGAVGGHFMDLYSLPLLPDRGYSGAYESSSRRDRSEDRDTDDDDDGSLNEDNDYIDNQGGGDEPNGGLPSAQNGEQPVSNGGTSADNASGENAPDAQSPETDNAPVEAQPPEEEPIPTDEPDEGRTPVEQQPVDIPPPVFSSAAASATLAPAGDVRYDPALVLDGRMDTAWAMRGSGGWIELRSDTEQYVSGIRILNGYTKYSDNLGIWLHNANNRPKDIRIHLSDGFYTNETLLDVFDERNPVFQDIPFDTVRKTTSIRILIDTVYPGDRWDDTCITLIVAY